MNRTMLTLIGAIIAIIAVMIILRRVIQVLGNGS